MVSCRMILHHQDGRIDETNVFGDGPNGMGSLFKLPGHAEHWWKVVALRWYAGKGVAELEPATPPAELLERYPVD
jgi:hypothetical protein